MNKLATTILLVSLTTPAMPFIEAMPTVVLAKSDKLANLEARVEKLSEMVSSLSKQVDLATTTTETQKQKVEELLKEAQSQENKYNDILGQWNEAKANLDKKVQELKVAEDNLNIAQAKLTEAQEMLASLREAGTATEEEIAEAEAKVTEAETAVTSAGNEVTTKTNEKTTAQNNFDILDGALKELAEQSDKANKDYQEAKATLETLTKELEQKKAEYDTKKAEYDKLRAEYEALSKAENEKPVNTTPAKPTKDPNKTLDEANKTVNNSKGKGSANIQATPTAPTQDIANGKNTSITIGTTTLTVLSLVGLTSGIALTKKRK